MSELKVQFGCGGNRLDGFANHDADVDITKRLPWGDDTVDFIFAEHVFEHVSGPDALRFLDECHRILKPGGKLRLCVPVLERLNIPDARDIILNHGHLCAYSETLLHLMVGAARFKSTLVCNRSDLDGHWRVIGKEKDDRETHRLEATK